MAAVMPYNAAQNADETEEDKYAADAGARNLAPSQASTGANPNDGNGGSSPAPYQPNDPQRPTTQQLSPQPASQMPTSDSPPPQTFAQMQAAGQARPPAPTGPATFDAAPQQDGGLLDTVSPNPGGGPVPPMVNAQMPSPGMIQAIQNGGGSTDQGGQMPPGSIPQAATPPKQWSLSDPRTQYEIMQQDYGGDANAFLAASPNASIAAFANLPHAGQSGYTYSTDGSVSDSTGQMISGPDASIAQTLAAARTPTNTFTPGTGGVAGIGGTGAPLPGSSPANYLQNGLNTDAQGNPIAGGYNALADLYKQLGITPGATNPQVQALLQQNPALASAMNASGGAGGASNSQISNGPQPFNPTTTGGSGFGTTLPMSGSGTSTGSNSDLLSMLLQGANGQGAGSAVQNATNQATLNLLKNPSPYGQQQVQDAYNWLGGQVDDQYALQRQQLGEEMAKRGLGSSTINAGRLNDLNIGQRSAKEGLAENLAQNYAQTLGNYQTGAINAGNSVGTQSQNSAQSWLAQLMGYGQNAFNNDLATQNTNQNAQNSYQNYILSLLGLGYGGS